MPEGLPDPLLAGCSRRCAPCRGPACGRHPGHGQRAGAPAAAVDVVQETIDAVSGATWATRNAIMEDLFKSDLADHGSEMPAYRPPGSA